MRRVHRAKPVIDMHVAVEDAYFPAGVARRSNREMCGNRHRRRTQRTLEEGSSLDFLDLVHRSRPRFRRCSRKLFSLESILQDVKWAG